MAKPTGYVADTHSLHGEPNAMKEQHVPQCDQHKSAHDAMNKKHPGVSFAPFDAADYLDDEETIAEYLAAASENPNPEVLRAAKQDVARARARRREEIAADARASIAAFRAGELKQYSAEELIAELHQSLEDQVDLPFGDGISNTATQRTFAETDAGENIVRCDDAQDMFTRLGA